MRNKLYLIELVVGDKKTLVDYVFAKDAIDAEHIGRRLVKTTDNIRVSRCVELAKQGN